MSELLLSFESNKDPELESESDSEDPQQFTLRLNEDVLRRFEENFRASQNICPILSVGHSSCGRSAILDRLVRKGEASDQEFELEPETEDESLFASEGRPMGVYVWPRPVRMGNVTLFLMKMWGVDFRETDEATTTLVNKVLVCMMSLTSMCLVCSEKGSLFQTLTSLQQVYTHVKDALSFDVSRFLVFAESPAQLSRANIKLQHSKFLASRHAGVTEFLYRGDRGISEECLNELCARVANAELHIPFLSTHQAVMPSLKAADMGQGLVIILTALVKVANLGLNFESFVEKVPHFANADFEREMMELEDMEQSLKLVQNASAFEFFVRDEDAYALNKAVIESLQLEYDLLKPTVVMVVIGNPGMGKSTLLNHIVRVNTGNRKCLELFKTGNTGAHTTKASQVFSHPLNLEGNQLMLIDLEGLGGMEIADPRMAILQANLVSAILTVASVPCILVRNELQTMQFVENIITRLCMLKDNFGFLMERIHLLFQDRDLKPGECDNPHFAKHVQNMNQLYFEGREVLKLRNKPNFSVREKAEMCEVFLKDLLEDSNFPKRNQSGTAANIANLLVEMQYIMGHQSTNLNEISLSVDEILRRDCLEGQKSKQLKCLADSIICPEEHMSLITIFNEECRQFMGACELELNSESPNVQKHVKTALETEADLHRLHLAQIEYCYIAVRAMSSLELKVRMMEQLEYFYREAWWINTFLERANELKQKLLHIGERYPRESEKLRIVLEEYEAKQANLRNWFLANYGIQIATTAASGGLGVAAKGATLAITAAKLGVAAVISGAAAVGRFAYGATTSLALTDTAVELYSFKRRAVRLNNKVSLSLSIESDIRILVLMVIGMKSMMTSFLLNEFIRHVAPFTSSSLQAFNEKKLTQTIHFSYQKPDFQREGRSTSCNCFVIYLRMKKNMSRHASLVAKKIATALISRVSLTCMFIDRSELYADSIINDAFKPAVEGEEWKTPIFTPKIATFYRNANKRTSFLSKLMNIGVPNIQVTMDKFNEQGMKSALVTVKSEFDISASMTAANLLGALENAEIETTAFASSLD